MERRRVIRPLLATPGDQASTALYIETGLVIELVPVGSEGGRALFRVLDAPSHLGRLYTADESDITECTEE